MLKKIHNVDIIAMYNCEMKGVNGLKGITVRELFALTDTLAAPLLESAGCPFEILGRISEKKKKTGPRLDPGIYEQKGDNVWIAKSAVVSPSASISGPCIIGERTQVRHCAFIRGSALVGNDCVVGNSTELKNVILIGSVQVPHYNYVGDSVLGFHSHMGAGAITSNVKSDKSPVVIKSGSERLETGLKKVGAFLGDYAEIGCGAVLNPGTVIGKNTSVYPLSFVRGVIPENSIYKNSGEVVTKRHEC